MSFLFRKTLIALIVVSLAAAGGFAPKHAHAGGPGGHQVAASHSHDSGGDHQHQHHHAARAQYYEYATASVDCDGHAAPAEQGGTSILNCCVASCAAIALIFAAFDLPDVPQSESFVAMTLDSLVLAARTSDDPPPR